MFCFAPLSTCSVLLQLNTCSVASAFRTRERLLRRFQCRWLSCLVWKYGASYISESMERFSFIFHVCIACSMRLSATKICTQ